MRLSWMYSTRYEDDLLPLDLITIGLIAVFLILVSACYLQEWNFQSTKSLAKFGVFHKLIVLQIGLSNEGMQLGVCIGNGIGEVHSLIPLFEVVLELQLKCLSIKTISTESLHEIDLIAVVLLPVSSFDQFIRSQSPWIEIFPLCEIADIELHLSCEIFIIDLEIIPAGMATSIRIASEEEVILILLHSDRHIQVSRLEGGVELHLTWRWIQVIAFSVVAHLFYRLLHFLDACVVASSVSPRIMVLLVDLNRVRASRTEKDEFESIVTWQVGEERIRIRIDVSQWQRTRGQLGSPSEDHIWYQ